MSLTPYERRAILYGTGGAFLGGALDYAINSPALRNLAREGLENLGSRYLSNAHERARTGGLYRTLGGPEQTFFNPDYQVTPRYEAGESSRAITDRPSLEGPPPKRLRFDGVDSMGLKRGVANPVLQGRFKRPRKHKGYDIFNKKGLKMEKHADNGVTGDASVVAGVSPAAAVGDMGFTVGCAVMKALLYKYCGYSFAEASDVFNSNAGLSDISKIVFNARWYDSSVTPHTWKTATADVLTAGKDLGHMGLQFRDNVFTNSEFSDRNLGKHLYSYTVINGVGSPVGYGLLNECFIRLYCYMHLDIQNVTQSDGAVDSTTVVDTNPLKGVLYHCKARQPQLRNEDEPSFAGHLVPVDGLISSGVLTGNPYSAPMSPAQYKKCTKYSRVVLKPGGIKRISLPFRFDGRLKDLIIGCNPGTFPDNLSGFGVCEFLHLEKAMNTGSSVKVSINYNLEYFIGAYVKKIAGQPTRKHLIGI